MSIEYDLKQQLDAIIDEAYKDATPETDPKLNTYKWYKITFANKKTNALAVYKWRTREIEMRIDERAENTNKYVTIIHELSHHIQHKKYEIYMKKWNLYYPPENIKTHGKEFYEIHVKLLIAAFRLGIVDYNEYLNMKQTARCDNKLRKMVLKEEYEPTVSNTNTEKRIYCYNSYNCKDKLKENGYSYNSQIKAWHKTVTNDEIGKEKTTLLEIGLKENDIIIKDAITMIDMKPEVEKQKSEYGFIIQYDFKKKYTVLEYSYYPEIKKLKEKCPYLKITKIKIDEFQDNELPKLLENGCMPSSFANVKAYVSKYIKKHK